MTAPPKSSMTRHPPAAVRETARTAMQQYIGQNREVDPAIVEFSDRICKGEPVDVCELAGIINEANDGLVLMMCGGYATQEWLTEVFGGAGSGNWGHKGVSGQHGGSAAGSGGLVAIGATAAHSPLARKGMSQLTRAKEAKEVGDYERSIDIRAAGVPLYGEAPLKVQSDAWMAKEKVVSDALKNREKLHKELQGRHQIRDASDPRMVAEDLKAIDAHYNRRVGQNTRRRIEEFEKYKAATKELGEKATLEFEVHNDGTFSNTWKPKRGYSQDEISALENKASQGLDRATARANKGFALKEERLTALRRGVQVGDPIKVSDARYFYGDFSAAQEAGINKRLDTAHQEFSAMVSAKNNEFATNGSISVTTNVAEYTTRAEYSPRHQAIRHGESDSVAVGVHKLGHALEHQNVLVNSSARKFLDYRTGAEKAVQLSKLKPTFNYDDDEMAKPDKFKNAYTGKIYEDGATEIVSMGVQQMYQNPAAFAKSDPEFFDFTYRVSRGEMWYPPGI